MPGYDGTTDLIDMMDARAAALTREAVCWDVARGNTNLDAPSSWLPNRRRFANVKSSS